MVFIGTSCDKTRAELWSGKRITGFFLYLLPKKTCDAWQEFHCNYICKSVGLSLSQLCLTADWYFCLFFFSYYIKFRLNGECLLIFIFKSCLIWTLIWLLQHNPMLELNGFFVTLVVCWKWLSYWRVNIFLNLKSLLLTQELRIF